MACRKTVGFPQQSTIIPSAFIHILDVITTLSFNSACVYPGSTLKYFPLTLSFSKKADVVKFLPFSYTKQDPINKVRMNSIAAEHQFFGILIQLHCI